MLKMMLAAGVAVLTMAVQTPVHAKDKYEGENVRIVINLGAGGSTGVMAQLFANHWKEHIPGDPNFVVQPVTGGAQMKGIIEARNARPDGFTIAWVAWSGPTRAIGPKSQNVDWSDFEVIAGVGVPQMAYMRNDVGDGVSGYEDLVGLQGVHIGGYRPGSYLDLTARMSLDLLGVDYDYTTGFGGGSKIVAALQRDEVNFHVTPAANYFGGIEDNVVEAGMGLPLWYYELTGSDGKPSQNDQFEGISTFRQVAETITGSPPSGPIWESLQWLNNGMAGVTWFIGVPAGVDAETVEMLRTTFAETISDPAFLAEAEEKTGIVPTYTPPVVMQTMIDGLKNVDPAIAETVTGYIESGTQ